MGNEGAHKSAMVISSTSKLTLERYSGFSLVKDRGNCFMSVMVVWSVSGANGISLMMSRDSSSLKSPVRNLVNFWLSGSMANTIFTPWAAKSARETFLTDTAFFTVVGSSSGSSSSSSSSSITFSWGSGVSVASTWAPIRTRLTARVLTDDRRLLPALPTGISMGTGMCGLSDSPEIEPRGVTASDTDDDRSFRIAMPESRRCEWIDDLRRKWPSDGFLNKSSSSNSSSFSSSALCTTFCESSFGSTRSSSTAATVASVGILKLGLGTWVLSGVSGSAALASFSGAVCSFCVAGGVVSATDSTGRFRTITAMRAIIKSQWKSPIADDWILKLAVHGDQFATSSSSGALRFHKLQDLTPFLAIDKAHESSINSIKSIDANTIASCSTDGVKVWDVRAASTPQISLSNDKSSNFLSLDYKNNILAAGTELVGVDSELHMWDLRHPETPVRSFVDSHHDDITDIKFHPTLSKYLMSGSTDGYVNIYDLEQTDEDDALHQVINYASVHSCHFINDHRISVLSHMETLAFYELNSTNYEEIEEPQPNDLQDVRNFLDDCEYVVDINPKGYISVGANSQSKLTLFPFNVGTEQIDKTRPIWFPSAHGEEVCRDLQVLPGGLTALSCGEDGSVNFWDLPYDVPLVAPFISGEEPKAAKEKKEKKHKHKKKDKEKKSKKSKDVRFKPY